MVILLDLKIGTGEGQDQKRLTSMETENWVKVTSQGERQHFGSYIQAANNAAALQQHVHMLLFLFPPEYFLSSDLDQFLLHSASHISQMWGRQ